jgi:hypothetical protein
MQCAAVPHGVQQSAATQCDGTQIAANTAERCAPAPAQVLLAHTAPRSRSRCAAEEGKPTAMKALHRVPADPELPYQGVQFTSCKHNYINSSY